MISKWFVCRDTQDVCRLGIFTTGRVGFKAGTSLFISTSFSFLQHNAPPLCSQSGTQTQNLDCAARCDHEPSINTCSMSERHAD